MQWRGLAPAVIALALASCAPTVDGLAEQQRSADITDGERLAIAVRALPGVVTAEVLLTRPVADPLTTGPAQAPALGIVATVDDHADRTATRTQIDALAHVLVADVAPQILVEVGTVAAPPRSRFGPRALLAIALAAVAAFAALLALRQRRGNSAQ